MKQNETNICAVCVSQGKVPRVTLYWHKTPEDKEKNIPCSIWCWCLRCQRSYDITGYCRESGLELKSLLKKQFDFQEVKPNEVNSMDWPTSFIPIFKDEAKPAVEYMKSRGIHAHKDVYYDSKTNGIVFPYFFDGTFVGAQTRLIDPWVFDDGNVCKITTLPGTRLGLLFYRYDGISLPKHIKGVIVTEGALNALAIQESLDSHYGSHLDNPWHAIACSGSSATEYQVETVKGFVDQGYKAIIAPDTDQAGFKMLRKFQANDALTHFAFTNSDDDWIDQYKSNPTEFTGYFLGQVIKHEKG